MKTSHKGLLIFSIVVLLLVSGCNLATPAATAEPTLDMAALRAEIVSTVVAQMTADAPKATPTTAPTATQTVKPTASLPTITPPVLTVIAPLSTFTVAAQTGNYTPWTETPYTDRATLSYQSLADGTTLTRGQDFDVKWVIKNQGVRNWNDQFYIRYISGVKCTHFDRVMLSPVNKGDETTFIGDFIAPTNPGFYVTQWGLVNDDGVPFFRFNFTFYVK
ncbi:MAG: NBR1-Ig-like domain-containing protein [Leptolinea sp.]